MSSLSRLLQHAELRHEDDDGKNSKEIKILHKRFTTGYALMNMLNTSEFLANVEKYFLVTDGECGYGNFHQNPTSHWFIVFYVF